MVSGWKCRLLCLCVLLLWVSAYTQDRSRYDPAAGKGGSQPHESFWDFVLKQVNPNDKDYGECIAEARKIAVEETIYNSLFWSNLVVLGLFGCSLMVLFYQHKELKRREQMVTTQFAQYVNGLRRAELQAHEATTRYNQLVESMDASYEGQIRPMKPNAKGNAGSTTTNATETGNANSGGAAITAVPDSIGQHTDVADKINALQQQLSSKQRELDASLQREQDLRRQLKQTEGKLEHEKERNRTLKGG
jgi:hypothetical protein